MLIIERNIAKRERIKLVHIYINTLIPYFKFRDSNGSLISPKKSGIVL